MNTFTLVLVMLAIIITMGAVIYVLAKGRKADKKEIDRLESNLYYAKENVTQLSAYIDKLQKIKADEKSVSQKIKEAKSDEEVFSIIASIVADNNNRVQND